MEVGTAVQNDEQKTRRNADDEYRSCSATCTIEQEMELKTGPRQAPPGEHK